MSNKIIKEAATHQPFPPGPESDASFVLLCLENSVRLYSASSVIQVGLVSFIQNTVIQRYFWL